MAYTHSFTPAFYGDSENAEEVERPTTLADALMSTTEEWWNDMCQEVFGCHSDYVEISTVVEKCIETDTVGSLSSPVSVWIDDEGFYTVNVYDQLAVDLRVVVTMMPEGEKWKTKTKQQLNK